ncbi:uncharacterized protein A4U43_C07F10510 [Asparagus officinalis]|uniref:Uncharacterized protein n=2 Tax=Asparagus officinalis TaxID=4686 RepID=A0A5P1EAU4_ASPOF|nr:uncharacterized protein A4U43_C07F10510 [Asparagus officinalis]
MFTLVGLMEFFYSEAPEGMRSLATSFSFLTISIGYFLSSAFVKAIDAMTGRMADNGQGWLYGTNFNANHVDRFYWFLAVLSCVNFGVYVLCARWYKYRRDGHDGGGGVVGSEEVEKSKGEKQENGGRQQALVKGEEGSDQ